MLPSPSVDHAHAPDDGGEKAIDFFFLTPMDAVMQEGYLWWILY